MFSCLLIIILHVMFHVASFSVTSFFSQSLVARIVVALFAGLVKSISPANGRGFAVMYQFRLLSEFLVSKRDIQCKKFMTSKSLLQTVVLAGFILIVIDCFRNSFAIIRCIIIFICVEILSLTINVKKLFYYHYIH